MLENPLCFLGHRVLVCKGLDFMTFQVITDPVFCGPEPELSLSVVLIHKEDKSEWGFLGI